ncbi:MAG TPA: hypothetical protein VG406_18420 [Isosphaeraceae bacterium]|jgi:hypothetical protein|nr:hypothetical protein [Isosphaeraceae bacterium]
MGPLLRDAAEAGDLLGACARAGVSVVEYHRARRADLAFDLAAGEIDAAMRLATLASLESQAAAGDLRATKLLTQVEGQLRQRAEALRLDAPRPDDSGPATTVAGLERVGWDPPEVRRERVAGVVGGWTARAVRCFGGGATTATTSPTGILQLLAPPDVATEAAMRALDAIWCAAHALASAGRPATTEAILDWLAHSHQVLCIRCRESLAPASRPASAFDPAQDAGARPLFACPQCDWEQGPGVSLPRDPAGVQCPRCGYFVADAPGEADGG